MVVPRSKAIANRRAVVSPGSTSISSSSTTTAVTSKPDERKTPPSTRSTPTEAVGSRSSIASSKPRRSGRWSSSVGSSSTTWRFCTDGRRITCRPTPARAAFGRVCSGGTSTTRSSRAIARQARRQPSSQLARAEGARIDRTHRQPSPTRRAPCTSCRCRSRRRSSRSRSRSSSRRRTPACHWAPAPRRPPAGTSAGRARRRRRAAPSSSSTARNVSRLRTERCGAAPLTTRRPPQQRLPRPHPMLPPPSAHGGRRSSWRPTRHDRAAGRPLAHCARRLRPST